MKKLQMVDLKGQYEEIKDEVNTAFGEVLETSAFINGPEVQKFQKNLEEYLGAKHVIPVSYTHLTLPTKA
jgi:dTDP-4-amino-4,6-dideoxygalactose transaminase